MNIQWRLQHRKKEQKGYIGAAGTQRPEGIKQEGKNDTHTSPGIEATAEADIGVETDGRGVGRTE